MPTDQQSSVEQYLRFDMAKVEGWLWPTTASMIADAVAYQAELGIRGDMCEIGVHHGKLFLILANLTGAEERVHAIDVFDDQSKNLDQSGSGDRSRFEANLVSFGRGLSNVAITQSSSLELGALGFAANNFRFISIDGGHTTEITENDLCLSEATLLGGGIVALDDILNSEWTGVLSGFAKYISRGGLVPFAIIPNKLLLTTDIHSALRYRERLSGSFPAALRKSGLEFFGFTIDVYFEHEIYDKAGDCPAEKERDAVLAPTASNPLIST